MQRFLHQALGWTVILVILAIIGTITSGAQTAFGDTGAAVTFCGLLALVVVGVAFYYDPILGKVLLSLPLGVLAAAFAVLGAVLVIGGIIASGYSLVLFFKEYGVLGAILLVLLVIAFQLMKLNTRR